MDTLIQKIFLKIRKINNFRGELTDNSAEKEALVLTVAIHTAGETDIVSALSIHATV